MSINFAASYLEVSVILSAIAAKLKSQSKDDFKGRHFEAGLIVQAVSVVPALPVELPRHRGTASRTRP